MKTILLTIGDGEVSKNILLSDAFRILKENVNLALAVQSRKKDYFEKNFASDRVRIHTIPQPSFPRLEEYFSDLFLYSLHTESIKVKIEHSYASGGSWLGRAIKYMLWSCGGWYPFRWFWRAVYRFLPDRSFDALLADIKPDLVFTANLIANEDSRLLKAAQRYGIKTVGMPKGWDNLTLKTFLGVFPDSLLVQTPAMKDDAICFLDYPKDRITVVGFSKFDPYARRDLLMPRDGFLRSLGLDPKNKIILYAGAGDQLAPHDEEILRDFLVAVNASKLNIPVQLIVRPHPKYRYRTEVLPPSPWWVYDRPGKIVGKKESDFEFDKEDILHLMNSLAHCDLLIHTASTLGIESAIFDKPSITIAFDGTKNVPPALSVTRYYNYVHLKRVISSGGMPLAHNFDELLRLTSEYLVHPEKDRQVRAKMAFENAYQIDGKAGSRVARYLLARIGETYH